MKKFLLGLLAGFVLAGMACVIFLFAMIRLGDRRPAIASDGILVLGLQGDVPEIAPMEIPLPFFESQAPVTLVEVWDLLRRAEKDSRVRALVLEPRFLSLGWGKLQEIRDGIQRFKRSGKPVYAFLRTPGLREYYLATAAEKIFVTPEDIVDVKGLRAVLTFYRRTLDKIGVEAEVEHAGKYKDAADSYTRTSMSPETREVMNSILDSLYGHVVEVIASSRKLKVEQVRAAIDEGPFLAPRAKQAGLIDDLRYDSQVYDDLKGRLKLKDIRKISHRDFARAVSPTLGGESRQRVALILGEGTIVRWASNDPFAEEEGIQSGPFVRTLRQVADDNSIKGAILRINSPGGDAIASDEILHEVRALSKRKPLVISMSDLAASGGYYISMSGDPVLSYPNTFTGSIGVIFGKVNAKGLYEKLGIDVDVLKRGRYADIDGAYKPMDEAGRRKLRDGVQKTYESFLARVSEGRKRPKDEIEPLAQGRVWLGSQAKANGLVDDLGGMDLALDTLRTRAKFRPDEQLRIEVFPRRRSLIDELLGSREQSAVQSAIQSGVRKQIQRWAVDLGLEGFDLRLWQRGGIFALPPYSIRVD